MTLPVATPAISCDALTVAIGDRLLVERLSFELAPGSWLAILGKNGSGKTLTLETLCGLREATSGDVLLHGSRLSTLSVQSLARTVTMVTQSQDDAFENSLLANALLGRYPYLGRWQRISASDEQLALEALKALALDDLIERDIRTLSGGERQRAAIAQAFTQNTPVLLLDEPVSQLDPAHAQQVLSEFAARAAQGRTLASSLHDVNVARQFSSHVLMLFGDGRWRFGSADEMMSEALLSELYGVPIVCIDDGAQDYFVSRAAGAAASR